MSVKRNSTVIPKTINVKTGSCKYTPCCAAGIPGIPGIPGPASPAGAMRSPGNNRPQGPRGTRGYKGEADPLGGQGPVGPKGPQRPSGEGGKKGDAGFRGPSGPKGVPRLFKGDVPPASPIEFEEFDSSEYLLFFIASLMFREFSVKCWLFAITFTLVYC